MPLLSQNLREHCLELLPKEISQQLYLYLRKNALDNLRLTSELLSALKIFSQNNIRAISFKGTVLAATVYGNTALRKIGDLDILIHKSDYTTVRTLLQEAGYQPQFELPWESHFTHENKQYDIDLHPRVSPKHLACGIQPQEWWTQTTSSTLSGSEVTHFSAEAQLMMICLNGTKECWRKLSRICDMAECLRAYPALDWDSLLAKAKQRGYERLLLLSLRVAYECLEAPLPQEIVERFYGDPQIEKLIKEIHRDMFEGEPWLVGETKRTFFFIRTRDRIQNRISCFAEFMKFYLFHKPISQSVDVFTVPESLSFLYYLVIPARVVKHILPNVRYVLFP